MDMIILIIIIIFLFSIWFFKSISQSGVTKNFFRAKRKGEDKVIRWTDNIEKKSIKFSIDFKNKKEKERVKDLESYITEIQKINVSREVVGLEKVDINDEIEELKSLGHYEGVDDLLKYKTFNSATLSCSFSGNKLYNINSASNFEEFVLSPKEVDSYIINFMKVRFYLTGLMYYPKLNCMDRYFSFKFPDLDEKNYEIIWQKVVEQTVLEYGDIKNISALYHFTNKKNLPSLLNHGILTRANLNKNFFEYSFNDNLRLDDNLDSVSLSLSHPNDKMFYKYRCLTPHDDWVVIRISPSLLYGKEECESEKIRDFQYLNKVVFCKKNAATSEMKNLTIRERMTCEAFLSMFDFPNGGSSKTYTHDVQAEILYQGDIPSEFIEEIYVNQEDSSLNWIEQLGFKVTKNKAVFDIRR